MLRMITQILVVKQKGLLTSKVIRASLHPNFLFNNVKANSSLVLLESSCD